MDATSVKQWMDTTIYKTVQNKKTKSCAADLNWYIQDAGQTRAAIVLLLEMEWPDIYRRLAYSQATYTQSGVSVTDNLVGVKTLKLEPGGDKVFGVFESESSNKLLMFVLEGHLVMTIIPDYVDNYACGIGDRKVFMHSTSKISAGFMNCVRDDKIHLARINADNSRANVGTIQNLSLVGFKKILGVVINDLGTRTFILYRT